MTALISQLSPKWTHFTDYRLTSVRFGFVCFQPIIFTWEIIILIMLSSQSAGLNVIASNSYTCRTINSHPISEWPLNFVIQRPKSSFGWRKSHRFWKICQWFRKHSTVDMRKRQPETASGKFRCKSVRHFADSSLRDRRKLRIENAEFCGKKRSLRSQAEWAQKCGVFSAQSGV